MRLLLSGHTRPAIDRGVVFAGVEQEPCAAEQDAAHRGLDGLHESIYSMDP